MSARLQDGTFKNLQVGSKTVIDENGNGTFNTLVVKGGSNSIWTSVFLPDNDQISWAPARNTWYFQSNLTTNRTLTLSQLSLNTAYPNAANGTMVFFDFPFTNNSNLNLHMLDVDGVRGTSGFSAPRTYDYIYYTSGAYVVKNGMFWFAVFPVLNYD